VSLGKTIGSAAVPLATANDPETERANKSQSKSDPSPKVNFARLFCETDSFRFGFDSGMDEGRSESTYGLGGSEIGWETGSGGDELDGRGEGELSEEDGVRSGGELDGREYGVRGGLDRSGSDGSGFNSESVLQCSIPTSGSQENGMPSPFTLLSSSS
jgi:hypothetical protein